MKKRIIIVISIVVLGLAGASAMAYFASLDTPQDFPTNI